jgi:hypothetical protein
MVQGGEQRAKPGEPLRHVGGAHRLGLGVDRSPGRVVQPGVRGEVGIGVRQPHPHCWPARRGHAPDEIAPGTTAAGAQIHDVTLTHCVECARQERRRDRVRCESLHDEAQEVRHGVPQRRGTP